MQATPTKKLASGNGIMATPPPTSSSVGGERGSMALCTPPDLLARLASMPKDRRHAIAQGYKTSSNVYAAPGSYSPRTPLSATRSEPNMLSGLFPASAPAGSASTSSTSSFFYSPSPSTSSSFASPGYSSASASASGSTASSSQYHPRGLMPMYETASLFDPASHNNNGPSYDASARSIMGKAHQALAWAGGQRQAAIEGGGQGTGLAPAYISPRKKRTQMDDDELDGDASQNTMRPLDGMEAVPEDEEQDQDGDHDMSGDMDEDLPLSLSQRRNQQAPHSQQQGSLSTGPLFSSPFPNAAPQGSSLAEGRERRLRSLPKRAPLGKTQSLPVDAFSRQQFAPDVFNTQEGF